MKKVGTAQATQCSSASPRVSGKLRLAFERVETGATILAAAEQRAPLRVVRAFPLDGGGALVHLHNVSGGVLGGDRLELAIDVGAGAWAQVTTTGATRVYRALGSAATPVETRAVRVATGGLLELLPDPLIPFAGARYRQDTRIELDAGAGLFWWETVTPGRTARGEIFAFDSLELAVEIRAGGTPVALERAKLEPAQRAPSVPARVGPYRYLATFYACRQGVPDTEWREIETQLAETADRLSGGGMVWGVSALSSSGVVARGLAVEGSGLPRALVELWRAAKRSLYGSEAVAPRKIN